MSKKKSAFALVKAAFPPEQGFEIRKAEARSFEIFNRGEYQCLLTFDSTQKKWLATHNMVLSPGNKAYRFDTPDDAFSDYLWHFGRPATDATGSR